MFDRWNDDFGDSVFADDFRASDQRDIVPPRDLDGATIRRRQYAMILRDRDETTVVREHRDIAIPSPTQEELRETVGCIDHDDANQQHRVRLLEMGLRRRYPSLTDGRLDAAIARVTRALSPPTPPSDGDWEAIRHKRAAYSPRSLPATVVRIQRRLDRSTSRLDGIRYYPGL